MRGKVFVDLKLAKDFLPQMTTAVFYEELNHENRRGNLKEIGIIVDGKPNGRPKNVKWGGKISAIDTTIDIGEILEYAWRELHRRSPILTGNYYSSHVILLNKKQYRSIEAVSLRYKQGDTITLVNTAIYAAKIEGRNVFLSKGVKTRMKSDRKFRPYKGLSAQAPNGVYGPVANELKRLFRGNFNFRFSYVPLNTGGMTTRFRRKGPERIDQAYPAIEITQKYHGRLNS